MLSLQAVFPTQGFEPVFPALVVGSLLAPPGMILKKRCMNDFKEIFLKPVARSTYFCHHLQLISCRTLRPDATWTHGPIRLRLNS